MCLKKLLVFLVGFCVLLAPVLSNAGMLMPAPATHAHDQPIDCHSTDADGGTVPAGTKLSHNCCFNFVGTLSAVCLIQPLQNAGELIDFSPALRLASRAEGLFRPPRQHS